MATAEQREFASYIKAIGRGKRAGQYLTQAQAERAMYLLLNRHSSSVLAEQMGAFLMLLRVREESIEELAGFLLACRQTLNFSTSSLPKVDLDMGCYAGKRRHLPWLVLAVMVLAEQGKRIFLHGSPESESNRLYLDALWRAFAWPVAEDPRQACQLIADNGFCYMDLADIHSQMADVIQLRSTLGLRSCMNTLARMLNPTAARVSLHGVFHTHVDERHVQVATLTGDRNVACFRGEGGEIEVNPEREFQLFKCVNGTVSQQWFPPLLEKRQIKPRELDPELMIRVWTGEVEIDYAQQAVIGTIAVALSALESLDSNTALARAQQLWCNRSKQWPNYQRRMAC